MEDIPMAKENIGGMLEATIGKIKEAVGGDMVIGKPINLPNGATAVPVSMVSFGFGSGGTDLPTKGTKDLFGGGAGGGVKVVPVAFLISSESGVRLVQLSNNQTAIDNIVQSVPEVVDKLVTILGDFTKSSDDKKDIEKAEQFGAETEI